LVAQVDMSGMVVNPDEQPSRRQVWRMFNRIAHRYDLLNHLLSFGTDKWWRRRAALALCHYQPRTLLDLATGTADQAIALHARCPSLERVVGADMAAEMLVRALPKIATPERHQAIRLVHGDALALPFAGAAFDAVTISFGIRNVEDVPAALREMRRILRPGGVALILEFSLPGSRPLRAGYLAYLRHVLPLLGGLISGDASAYRYLNRTVETFPYGEAFLALMRDAGFGDTRFIPMTFGVASIYLGVNPA